MPRPKTAQWLKKMRCGGYRLPQYQLEQLAALSAEQNISQSELLKIALEEHFGLTKEKYLNENNI